MQLISYIQILRPVNLLISIICILLSKMILSIQSDIPFFIFNQTPWSLILLVFLLGGFSNIINDIFDYQIDSKNRLNRPIVTNQISIKAASVYAFILLCLSCYIALNFNSITQSLIFFIIIPLMIFYTPFFKKIPLFGNFVVSAILSMVFIITSTYYIGRVHSSLIPPIVFSFFLMLIREIVKDIADFEGDQKFNINTLPIRFGIDFAVIFVYLFSFLLLISSILVYYLYDSYDLFYLITILLFIHFPLFFSIYHLSKNKTSIYCIYLSKVLKLLTIFGVIVIYLANN